MPATGAAQRLSRPAVRQEYDPFSGDRDLESIISSRCQETTLIVGRRDIEFTDLGADRVQIAIRVTNAGRAQSAVAPAVIRAAPFGAFVVWQILAVARVPALDPGESTVLRTVAQRPVPTPRGSPDRVSPRRVLTALGFREYQPPDPFPAGRSAADRTPATPTAAGIKGFLSGLVNAPESLGKLPASPFDLLTGRDTYWAGNLNIFIGNQNVERHVAKALRIVPGCTNAAMFVVGDGSGPESYRFDLVGLANDWEAAIYDPMSAWSLALGLHSGTQITLGAWQSLRARSLLLLALRPPAVCHEGNVEVRVTQRSTQKTAVVEFSFDPRASGPGCYVVQ